MVYSIWFEKEENAFDINVWNETENERAEHLEVYNLKTIEEANEKIHEIIAKNNIDKFDIVAN